MGLAVTRLLLLGPERMGGEEEKTHTNTDTHTSAQLQIHQKTDPGRLAYTDL